MAFGDSGVPASSGRAQIKYNGHDDTDALFVGRTIGEIRTSRGGNWNLPADARAYKGREQLDDSYTVRAGDSIEFHRRMGEKG